MKKIILILSVITLSYNLSACSPIIIVGAAAGASATIATDRRTAGKIVEDQAIEIQASDFIYSHEVFGKKVHVDVTSINNIVLLTGETPKAEYRQTIYDKVMSMRPVKKVINKIQIRKVLSAKERSNDLWITSKIKTRILARKGLLSRTKVITADSQVYLMGLVNDQEAKEVLAIINDLSGYKSVIPLYEAYKGSLPKKLSAGEYKSPERIEAEQKKVEETREKTLKEEDEITMKPYVIQPPIALENDK